jgi:hypothetical protein
VEVGFRSKEVLFLSCEKHDYIIVNCHIVHRKVCFVGTFVNAHLVVDHCVDGACYVVTSVHCVGVPHVIRVMIVLLHVLIMLLLLLLFIIFLVLMIFSQVFMVLLAFINFVNFVTIIVNHVVGAHHVILSLFVVGITLAFTLSCKLELDWR